MALRTEFQLPGLTETEVNKYITKKRFDVRAEVRRQGNGRVGFYYGWASMPAYLSEAPTFPPEWQARYFFHEEVFDLDLVQGRYDHGENAEAVSLIVQKAFSTRAGRICFEVDIEGSDLKSIADAFQMLRTGKLQPSEAFKTSPGTIEAPKPDEPVAKEGSGPHTLPQPAATATAA